jgi:hypothetical protein
VAVPTFLGPLLGISSQSVRATATGRVVSGNSTDCLRPRAVADKWIENGTTAGQFIRWDSTGAELTPHDTYRLPWDTSTDGPTGFQYPNDVGYEQTLIAAHAATVRFLSAGLFRSNCQTAPGGIHPGRRPTGRPFRIVSANP